MKKLFTAVLTGLLFTFQGCAMAQGKLIDEILNSTKPERFKPVDVSSLVLRYIKPGIEKESAILELKHQGFDVKEEKRKLEGCFDCDETVVLGGFTKNAVLPILPYESFISIGIGFKSGKVAFVTASHTKNVY